MKTELKAKFISYLAQRKKGNEGFTLIELLVVIIIIGILSAIALPSFLNQANKAKQSEAKQYVGSLVRAQQAYFLENSAFASDADELGRVVKDSTTNYKYTLKTDAIGTTSENVSVMGNQNGKPALKSYIGHVKLGLVTSTSEATTLAVLCESKAAGATLAAGDADAAGADAGTKCKKGPELGLK